MNSIKDIEGKVETIKISVGKGSAKSKVLNNGLRIPVEGGNSRLSISFKSDAPAEAHLDCLLEVRVPIDCAENDNFVVKDISKGNDFQARARDLIPKIKSSVISRLELYVDNYLGEFLKDLHLLAKKDKKTRGYD